MNEQQTRETKTIETPGGRKIVLNTYITGREARDIQNVYLEKMTLKQTAQGQEMAGLKGTATGEAENKAIEVVVVSMDDNNKDLVNRILDLKVSEYDFIKEEIGKVTSPETDEDKKKV